MKELILNEEGASAVEYAMTIGLIALVAIVALHWLAIRLHMVMLQIFWQYLWW